MYIDLSLQLKRCLFEMALRTRYNFIKIFLQLFISPVSIHNIPQQRSILKKQIQCTYNVHMLFIHEINLIFVWFGQVKPLLRYQFSFKSHLHGVKKIRKVLYIHLTSALSTYKRNYTQRRKEYNYSTFDSRREAREDAVHTVRCL